MASPAHTTAESHATLDAPYDPSPHSESPEIQDLDDASAHNVADDGTGAPKPQPMQKRRRVTRACDECRRKKIKCDGKQPCTHCTVYSYGMLPLSLPACCWPTANPSAEWYLLPRPSACPPARRFADAPIVPTTSRPTVDEMQPPSTLKPSRASSNVQKPCCTSFSPPSTLMTPVSMPTFRAACSRSCPSQHRHARPCCPPTLA